MPRILLAAAVAAAFALVAQAAEARPNGEGPARPNGNDPCATGQAVGNPCRGNNGNDKAVGNAQKEEDLGWCAGSGGTYCRQEEGAGEAVEGRGPGGVYISQVGDGNVARVDQSGSAEAHLTLRQDGDENRAQLSQAGGPSYMELSQSGDQNVAVASQSGPDKSSLIAAQMGAGNVANLTQAASGGLNAAVVAQYGEGNDLNLLQNGAENDASLAQTGDGNAMTLTQVGVGNKASWSQQGVGLPDLNVTQTGGMAVTIYQGNGP